MAILKKSRFTVFQYSIGDACSEVRRDFVGGHIFQYSIGDAWLFLFIAPAVSLAVFQYSIGDAGASCLWFLLFLSFCVGVCVGFCGCLLTVVVLALSLCWRAEKRGVRICVFFLLGVGRRYVCGGHG